ncbi:hypothetical protein M5E06_20850 [Azospirillum sp. A1-3]|uniref:hypothetical protein n=1 Tax=Azospirillum sp. A1-3 TaxID=185874 RepID=UPI00207767FD|nr:hypothetical protein [Azospirillum sp. A1-3]MCM8736580.1 hypothetical protein [Azospirillum sp. A1-3]
MKEQNSTPATTVGHDIMIRQEDREIVARILAAVAVDDDEECTTPLRVGWAHMQSSRGWR